MRRPVTCLSLLAVSALLLSALPVLLGSAVAVAGNEDWVVTGIPGVSSILDLEMLDADTAWAVGTIPGGGGVILKTTDGGAGWTTQKTLTGSWPGMALSSISVVDADTAWASGYRVLLKTTDGGANWDTVYSSTSMYEGVPDICAVDADNAWAILIDATLSSYIFKTSDGGATWANLYERAYAGGVLARISAVDNATAWAVGGGIPGGVTSAGSIIKTTDMGMTWQEQTPAGTPMMSNVRALDAGTAWASGRGVVMRTVDGGANWATVYNSGDSTDFWGLEVDGDSGVWIAGIVTSSATGGRMLKTVDQGSTWESLYSSSSGGLYCVTTADAANAMAGGQNSSLGSVVLNTVNGGSARPDITGTAPASGTAGDVVTIAGCDFGDARGASRVFFGGTEAASYLSWSDGGVVVTVPAGLSGSCGVTVTTAAGTSNAVSFMAAYPIEVTSVDPASGLQFTLSLETKLAGNGFLPGAAVRFVLGGAVLEAYNVNVVSENEITCAIGLFGVEPGAYDIVVVNQDGGMATLEDGFTVTAACGSGAGTVALALGGMLGLLSLGRGLKRRRRR